ncbi:MAG: hypothetical protein ACKVKL_09775 [Pseudomonadales bacterium]
MDSKWERDGWKVSLGEILPRKFAEARELKRFQSTRLVFVTKMDESLYPVVNFRVYN